MTNYFLPVVSVTMVEGVEGVIGGVEYWRGLFVYAVLWVDPLDAQDSSARLYPSFPTLAQKCQRAFHNKYSRTERPFPSRHSLIRQKNGDSNKPITTVLYETYEQLGDHSTRNTWFVPNHTSSHQVWKDPTSNVLNRPLTVITDVNLTTFTSFNTVESHVSLTVISWRSLKD